MASLADISRRANVSIATASRVLNGSSHPVSDATRTRVLAAADELGYRPSELARALVKRTSRIVGVIVGDIVDPYFAEIAHGVDHVAGAAGHLTMVCNTERRPEAELAHLGVLLDYHAAGVVFAGSGYENAAEAAALRSVVQDMQTRGSAVVALAARDLDCPSVLVDNRAAARDATEHLLGLGHRRIAFVEGPPGLHTSAHRLEGFEEAMAAAGAEPARLPGGFEYEAGDAAAGALLAAGELPDAILAVDRNRRREEAQAQSLRLAGLLSRRKLAQRLEVAPDARIGVLGSDAFEVVRVRNKRRDVLVLQLLCERF